MLFWMGLRISRVSGRAGVPQTKIWWQQSIFGQTFSTQPSTRVSAPLVLKFSQFAYLFEEGPTETIYRGTPLEGLGQHQQGQLAQEWARSVLQEQNPESEILDPELGTDSNGNARSLYHAPYDFLMDGRRVEVKSARLGWDVCRLRWHLRFWDVKLPFGKRLEAEFDDLYLVAVSPHGLTLVKHDLFTGVSTSGRLTETKGHSIQIRSWRGEAGWEEALRRMMWTLCEVGSCKVIANEAFRSQFQHMSWTGGSPGSEGNSLYLQCPMRNMSKEKRGLRIANTGDGPPNQSKTQPSQLHQLPNSRSCDRRLAKGWPTH